EAKRRPRLRMGTVGVLREEPVIEDRGLAALAKTGEGQRQVASRFYVRRHPFENTAKPGLGGRRITTPQGKDADLQLRLRKVRRQVQRRAERAQRLFVPIPHRE